MTNEKLTKKKKITFAEHQVVTDRNGEVLQEVKNFTYEVEAEPPYVKLYIQDIGNLHGLPGFVQDIFHELLKNMGYNNIIPMYKPVKLIICEKLNISINTLNKAVDSLYQKGILIRKARGMYMMDPSIAGRGSWKDIKKIIMTIEYDNNGNRKINSEISKEDNPFSQ